MRVVKVRTLENGTVQERVVYQRLSSRHAVELAAELDRAVPQMGPVRFVVREEEAKSPEMGGAVKG